MVEGSPADIHMRGSSQSGVGSSPGIPWLEDDTTAETQKFIDRIDKYLIEFMLEKSDRLGKEDVEE